MTFTETSCGFVGAGKSPLLSVVLLGASSFLPSSSLLLLFEDGGFEEGPPSSDEEGGVGRFDRFSAVRRAAFTASMPS